MKEKINIKTIGCSLMLLAILLGFSACNNEDDVMEIFNNKTWKLSRIELLKTDGNFTLNFNCAEVNGEVTGTVSAHAVKSSIDDATLKIDGKEHTINIGGKVIGTESDKLAKVFINGVLNVFKYEGDIHNLTLYFKDGNTTKVMGFTAR